MDAPFLQTVTEFISRHQGWAGFVLGAFTFLESMLFIGAFAPATPLMVVAGGLIAAGVLDPASVILWGAAGASAGDAISYWIGRRFGRRVLRGAMFATHGRAIALTRLLMRRFGSASIYMGRFFGPLRAFVPTAAGMLGMPQRRFQIANVTSAFVWTIVMILPGYFGVRGLEQIESFDDAASVIVALAVLIVVASFVGWRWVQRVANSRAARRSLVRR